MAFPDPSLGINQNHQVVSKYPAGASPLPQGAKENYKVENNDIETRSEKRSSVATVMEKCGKVIMGSN